MTQKQIAEIIEEDSTLKLVASSFTEVASIKLQRIRGRIERNRQFFEEISRLYSAVKKLSEEKAAPYQTVRGATKIGSAAILLTSNYQFYGGLERRLTYFYLNTLKNFPADWIVIGKSALGFFRYSGFNKLYKSIILEGDIPREEELRNLSFLISKYKQVLIFYPRFQSVLVQKPQMTDLTESGTNISPRKVKIDYILEPEIEKMLQFFESQILNLLLEQTFLEAELARTSARLISMHQAQDNADLVISDLRKALTRAKRSVENQEILETESAMFQFRKEIL